MKNIDVTVDVEKQIIYTNGEEFAGYYIPSLDWGKHGGRICFNRWKKAIDMNFPVAPDSFDNVEKLVDWISENL